MVQLVPMDDLHLIVHTGHRIDGMGGNHNIDRWILNIYWIDKGGRWTYFHKQIKMTDRLLNRKAERLEQLHDQQNQIMSLDEQRQCQQLKKVFNDMVRLEGGKPFKVYIPPDTTEATFLCFKYATKRQGENPQMYGNYMVFS
jgi:hypothetical protein